MTELAFPSGLARRSGQLGLARLRDVLDCQQVYGFRDVAIEGLAFHSAEVRPGNLFFAIPGSQRDGARYANQAVARGAVAVVAEAPLRVGCPVMVVDDARRALADAAGFYYGAPSRSLSVVGVTGTNGKTTIAQLIRACLEADRKGTGVLGTIGYEYGGRRIPATTTTPDPVRVHGYLREMVDRGLQACVMEVSSHALAQDRVRGVDFDVAVFSNLSQDHLDYHRDMREYAAAKARLFAGLEAGAQACIGIDSPWAEAMLDAVPPGVLVRTFGFHPDAALRAENLECTLEGTRFELIMPRGRVDLMLRLPGRHNVQNALAASSAALAMGVSELTIASALESAPPVRGRLELVAQSRGRRVFVDYAHTPDALDKVCRTLRELGGGRLLVVFGCGGDRDTDKRPQMARAVGRWAHAVVLTSDNPRSEDPEHILDQIEAGFHGSDVPRVRMADRGEAIACAIDELRTGDTLLIAGKGHETYQILRDSVVPFDDRLVARELLGLPRGEAVAAGSAEAMSSEEGR